MRPSHTAREADSRPQAPTLPEALRHLRVHRAREPAESRHRTARRRRWSPVYRVAWCRIGAIRREKGACKRHERAAWLGQIGVTVTVLRECRPPRDAEGGTRTHTRFPPPDFESGASTGSATSALLEESTSIAPAPADDERTTGAVVKAGPAWPTAGLAWPRCGSGSSQEAGTAPA
jgi:hypothetical protein